MSHEFTETWNHYPPEVLQAQDGKTVPLTWKTGGPVIGTVTMKYVPEEKVLLANFRVDDAYASEFLSQDARTMYSITKES